MSKGHDSEVWRDVKGYEGLYQVSNKGRVKSLDRMVSSVSASGKLYSRRQFGRIMSPGGSKDGYVSVMLCKDSVATSREVHRLVAETFLGDCPEGMECCHEDGDKRNNRLDNLRWDTRKGNHADKKEHGTSYRGEKHHNSKLTADKVRKIRKLWATGKYRQRELGNMFDLSQIHISQLVRRTRWSHIDA